MLDVSSFVAQYAHREALKGDPVAYVGNYVSATMRAIGRRMEKREWPGINISFGALHRFRTLSFFEKKETTPKFMLLWAPLPLLKNRDRQVYVVAEMTPQRRGLEVNELVAAFDLSGKEVLTCLLGDYPTSPGEKLQEGINKLLAYTHSKLSACL